MAQFVPVANVNRRPCNVLVDRAFLDEAEESPEAEAVCRAVVHRAARHCTHFWGFLTRLFYRYVCGGVPNGESKVQFVCRGKLYTFRIEVVNSVRGITLVNQLALVTAV